MFRSRSWFGGGLFKPKNPHSLEHLKYLYNVLSKNQIVSESNRGLLVETLRSIAEILIWGDQNDSSVFDFFLEKNMLSFFLKIMKQKCGSYVCVQLLQTLNILFENIRNETSLYYLLSNNHVNSIIVHKFDFSDEEVMAYYISFLKTLSLKLNGHTIHFFYNEHTNDFPLYTEAIKFFNHSESMVRIAVRTLTLNVYRVEDRSMLRFIRDRTAAPYFSNLVWFIGNHVLELDACVRNDADHQSKNRLADLVAEHLDHLHYLNDILCLDIPDLNQVLTDHLLNKLLVPLYVFSLDRQKAKPSSPKNSSPYVSSVVSLFLLSQVFLILTHAPLVDTLAKIILHADRQIFCNSSTQDKIVLLQQGKTSVIQPGFLPPTESLEISLETSLDMSNLSTSGDGSDLASPCTSESRSRQSSIEDGGSIAEHPEGKAENNSEDTNLNITDEEKHMLKVLACQSGAVPCPPTVSGDVKTLSNEGPMLLSPEGPVPLAQPLSTQPFIESVYNALNCHENDYAALFALCLLYAFGRNKGVSGALLHGVLYPCQRPEGPCSPLAHRYNVPLVERLVSVITLSCQPNAKVRLVTLELTIRLLTQIVIHANSSFLQDCHLAAIEGAKEESSSVLRNFYKSEEIFLDMFEDEYHEMKKRPLNVEWLTMDSNVLLPPTGTPLTGIEFGKRLPCGEVERARRAIRVFLMVRDLSLVLGMEEERALPLTDTTACVQVDHVLNLNNSDLIGCTVVSKDGSKVHRFLVIDVIQLILVEPTRRLGYGVAKLVGFLQDIEVTGDKDDSRCLHITIHQPLSSGASKQVPLLAAKFIFDDHIRCMAAKQRLTKGRTKARQKKMAQIARLLDIPASQPSAPSSAYNLLTARRQESALRSGVRIAGGREQRQLYNAPKMPGHAAVLRRESASSPSNPSKSPDRTRIRESSRSREVSPKPLCPRSEEIPLEDVAKVKEHSVPKDNGPVPAPSSILLPNSTSFSPSHIPYQTAAVSESISTASSTSSSSSAPEQSEETSFTRQTSQGSKNNGQRRRGQVETV
ncbi:Protein CLEC16A-like protein [Frankliniella fusca]|uniref:Protein CLEC16A-like protein n=1 Tax=Frankliniella fusca TaxID=407009 RepID=A0AAE1HUP6_9NEOP|nr:Protein CLEC16A-like protein [Frankliniella fusca]